MNRPRPQDGWQPPPTGGFAAPLQWADVPAVASIFLPPAGDFLQWRALQVEAIESLVVLAPGRIADPPLVVEQHALAAGHQGHSNAPAYLIQIKTGLPTRA